MQVKFNYTSGGELTTKDNLPYSGYFNVDEIGNVYSGRYYDGTSESLLYPTSVYSIDYHKSKYFKDRNILDDVTLPHTLDEIIIQPNEIVNFGVLNKKIEYLHDNLIYMYSKMFMGSTDVPFDKNMNTLCNLIGSIDFKWINKNDHPIFAFSPLSSSQIWNKYSEYDKMKRFVVVPFSNNTGVSIFSISNTHLIALTSSVSDTGQLSGAEITLYTNVIDNNTNETCKSLEDITFDGRYLYISDSQINGGGQIFKYDITSYYTNDAMFENKRFLVETIGGIGEIDRKNKFSGCSILGCNQTEIWVYDNGSNSIKIYDTNFVWKKTVKIPSIRKYKVIDIRHRIMNNHVYVLFEDTYDPNSTKYGLFEYDEKHNNINTYVFEDILFDHIDMGFKRIAFSGQDSNVFYAITNNSVFKKFITKPESTFAVLDRTKIYTNDGFIWDLVSDEWNSVQDSRTWNYAEHYDDSLVVNDIFILPTNNNVDSVFFMGTSYISHLNERTDYLSLLKRDDLPYYNYEKVRFDKMEYNQSFVLNKEFYKLFSNVIQFKNNLKGRFYAEYDIYGDLVYKDYIYITDDEINTLDIELEYNSFINDNELIQPNVINRLFKKIYEFEINLLNLTKVKLKNLKTWVDLRGGTNIYPIE